MERASPATGRGGARRRSPTRSALLLHLDIDAFLASVAQLVEPSLLGLPVVVGSGVVASRSYEAKARGVETAMPIAEAMRRCPGLVLREGDAFVAERFRRRVAAILGGFAPLVEVGSLDDMYADLSGLFAEELWQAPPDATGLAPLDHALAAWTAALRARVRGETGLSVSLGLGPTRTLARLATDRAKPGGTFRVRPGEERAFLDPLPVAKLPGVGRRTAAELERYRIRTVGELRLVDRALLEECFGRRGGDLWLRARGLPAGSKDLVVHGGAEHGRAGGAFGADGLAKELSRETTLVEPSADPGLLRAMLSYLVDRASHRLRGQDRLAGRLELRLAAWAAEAAARPALRRARAASSGRAGAAAARASAGAAMSSSPWPWPCSTRPSGPGGCSPAAPACACRTSSRRTPAPGADLFALLVAEGGAGLRGDGLQALRARRLDESLDAVRARHGFGAVVAGASIALLGSLPRTRDGFRLYAPSLSL
ncbi:MAG: hypothetical protein R3F30_02500 [Planctomycetota bacterium]